MGHVGRNLDFEDATADKGDHRVQVRISANGRFQGFKALVVLPERVLEFEERLLVKESDKLTLYD